MPLSAYTLRYNSFLNQYAVLCFYQMFCYALKNRSEKMQEYYEEKLAEAIKNEDLEELAGLLDGSKVYSDGVKLRVDKAIRDDDKECYPLIIAIENNCLKSAKLLIEKGAPVNSSSNHPWSQPLIYAACQTKSLEMVKLLYENGADVNWKFDNICPVISFVAEHRSYDIAKYLLDECGAKISVEGDDYGGTTLDYAYRSHDEKIIELIENEMDNHPEKYDIDTHLIFGVQTNNEDKVRKSLSAGANPNVNFEENLEDTSVLKCALTYDYNDIASILIEAGAEVGMNEWRYAEDEKLRPQLQEIAFSQFTESLASKTNPELISLYMDNDDLLNSTEEREAFAKQLRSKIMQQYEKDVKDDNLADYRKADYTDQFFKEQKEAAMQARDLQQIDIFYKIGIIGFSEFQDLVKDATLNNDLQAIKYCEEKERLGNTLNSLKDEPQHPVIVAAKEGYTELFQHLISSYEAYLADEKVYSSYKTQYKEILHSAYKEAVKNNHPDIALTLQDKIGISTEKAIKMAQYNTKYKYAHSLATQMILNLRSFVNAGDKEKSEDLLKKNPNFFKTMFMKAAQRNDAETVELLVKAGMDVNTQNVKIYKTSTTALDNAIQNGHLKLSEKLVDLGAAPTDNTLAYASRSGLKAVKYMMNVINKRFVADNMTDETRKTLTDMKNRALFTAASNGKTDICRYLVENGADYKYTSDGKKSIHVAAENGHMETVIFFNELQNRDKKQQLIKQKSVKQEYLKTQKKVKLKAMTQNGAVNKQGVKISEQIAAERIHGKDLNAAHPQAMTATEIREYVADPKSFVEKIKNR